MSESTVMDTETPVSGSAGGAGDLSPKSASKWPYRVPWQVPVSAVISMIGLGISAYLTLIHYDTAVPLECSAHGIVDCAAVVTSPQSIIFGLPVAVYGLFWHAVMFVAFLPWAWRASAGLGRLGPVWGRRIGYFRLGAVIVAIGFVIYLIHVELFDVHKICLWCTSVHVTTFLLLITVISSTSWSLGQGFEPEDDE